MLLLPLSAQLFVPGVHQGVAVRQPLRSGSGGIGMASKPLSVDVSDLGVTMDDLKAPISDMLEVEASGCESTSRVSPDTGCVWSETASRVEARSQKSHHPKAESGRSLAPAHARCTRQRSRGCHATRPGCGPICPACSHARAGDADHPGAARPTRRLARGRDDGDHRHHHGLWQGGLVVRARARSRARPDGRRPAEVAQVAGKLLRASLGPAPAPLGAARLRPRRLAAACATCSLPDPGAPWLGGSGLRADRGGAGRATDDAHAAGGAAHRRQGADRPLGWADRADRGR